MRYCNFYTHKNHINCRIDLFLIILEHPLASLINNTLLKLQLVLSTDKLGIVTSIQAIEFLWRLSWITLLGKIGSSFHFFVSSII